MTIPAVRRAVLRCHAGSLVGAGRTRGCEIKSLDDRERVAEEADGDRPERFRVAGGRDPVRSGRHPRA